MCDHFLLILEYHSWSGGKYFYKAERQSTSVKY